MLKILWCPAAMAFHIAVLPCASLMFTLHACLSSTSTQSSYPLDAAMCCDGVAKNSVRIKWLCSAWMRGMPWIRVVCMFAYQCCSALGVADVSVLPCPEEVLE